MQVSKLFGKRLSHLTHGFNTHTRLMYVLLTILVYCDRKSIIIIITFVIYQGTQGWGVAEKQIIRIS